MITPGLTYATTALGEYGTGLLVIALGPLIGILFLVLAQALKEAFGKTRYWPRWFDTYLAVARLASALSIGLAVGSAASINKQLLNVTPWLTTLFIEVSFLCCGMYWLYVKRHKRARGHSEAAAAECRPPVSASPPHQPPPPKVATDPVVRPTPTPVRTGTRTALYRYWDVRGELLYVGVAGNPDVRWREHRGRSEWAKFSEDRQVEWFESRRDALKAEAAAIWNERPVFNIAGSRPGAHRWRAAYLAEFAEFERESL